MFSYLDLAIVNQRPERKNRGCEKCTSLNRTFWKSNWQQLSKSLSQLKRSIWIIVKKGVLSPWNKDHSGDSWEGERTNNRHCRYNHGRNGSHEKWIFLMLSFHHHRLYLCRFLAWLVHSQLCADCVIRPHRLVR